MIISKWKGIGRNYGSRVFLQKLRCFYGVCCEDAFLFGAALYRRVFNATTNALTLIALKKMNCTASSDMLARRRCEKKPRIGIT
jgi:hypothetical protein